MEEKEGGDTNRPHTIDKGGRRKGILPMLGQGSCGCPSRGIRELLGRHDGRCQPTRHPCQEAYNSTKGHPVGPPYSWGQRLGQVELHSSTVVTFFGVDWGNVAGYFTGTSWNCELWTVFVFILYTDGVGANPGNLPCTTCVRPGCKRYTVGGKRGGWF